MIWILRHSLKEKFVFRGQHTKRSQKPTLPYADPPTRRHVSPERRHAHTPTRRHVSPERRPADTFPPTPTRRHAHTPTRSPPMPRDHNYSVNVIWTGNTGTGTSGYQAYKRDHEIKAAGRPPIPGSADPKFLGDSARYNPEELLVAALSTCHMLWYLHLCADAGVVVMSYEDQAEGTMRETADGGGRFIKVTLRPHAIVKGSIAQAEALHQRAHELCFIANSVNFPVEHKSVTELATF
jgi:organic hydroperoxide reductase OsmC/OhrA